MIRIPLNQDDVLLLGLNIFHTFSNVSILDFEQVNVIWVVSVKQEKWS